MSLPQWYSDWQSQEHAAQFDYRSVLDRRNLVRNYEGFNDVRLLKERLDRVRPLALLEVGCATGEFYRYLRLQYPRVEYYGLDISKPAIARAKEKYPKANFFVTRPEVKISDILKELSLPEAPEVVYAKDVVHHQTRPFEFLSDLLQIPSVMAIFRCRTRDVGKTEWNPDLSCQYHYEGWMPYIVTNLDELISRIREEASQSEIVAYRNHVILGGQNRRYLPKDCYLKTTGTAETAVGVFKETSFPGKVTIQDRPDMNPRYTLGYRFSRLARRVLRIR